MYRKVKKEMKQNRKKKERETKKIGKEKERPVSSKKKRFWQSSIVKTIKKRIRHGRLYVERKNGSLGNDLEELIERNYVI